MRLQFDPYWVLLYLQPLPQLRMRQNLALKQAMLLHFPFVPQGDCYYFLVDQAD